MAEESELSEREREILRLVATGASNKEIARALVISPNTVKVHLRNIFAKVGVASRTEATLYAIRTGLLPPPTSETAAPAAESASTVVFETPEPAPQETFPTPPETREPPLRRWLLVAALILAVAALIGLGSYLWQRSNPIETAQPTLPAQVSVTVPKRWSLEPALPQPVSAAAGAVYDDHIYLSGGSIASGMSSKTWRYDLPGKTWQPLADKPTPTSQMQAALLGEKIYFPGGKLADGKPTDRVEVYDPRLDRWDSAAPLPVALYGYGLVALEGKLYLIGGWDGTRAVNSVYAYDPQTDRWEARSPMPTARANLAAAISGGKIMALGGWDGKRALDNVEVYYPTRDLGNDTAWEKRGGLPRARYGMGVAAMADVVYLVGGTGTNPEETLAPIQFAPQTGAWSSFDSSPQAPGRWALLLPLETHLHLLGGEQDGKPTSQHQAYQAIYNIMFPVIQ